MKSENLLIKYINVNAVMKHVITEKGTPRMRAIRVLLTVVLIVGMLGLKTGMSFGESPEPGSLIIDPNSISTDNEKEGNILAEQGFSFFTEESMSEMTIMFSHMIREA